MRADICFDSLVVACRIVTVLRLGSYAGTEQLSEGTYDLALEGIHMCLLRLSYDMQW